MITSFVVALAIVFVAELPDKTMFATVVLTTRYRRPWAVFIGVNLAFAGHAALAAGLGEALRQLPDRPVQFSVAAMFLVGGAVMLRGGDDDNERGAGRPAVSTGAVIAASAAFVGLAEFGDFTQLATIGVVARYGFPIVAALGSFLAHAAVAGLAVVAGGWLQRRLPVGVITRAAAVLFIVFGMITLGSALWS